MAEACAAPHSRNLKMVDLVERETRVDLVEDQMVEVYQI